MRLRRLFRHSLAPSRALRRAFPQAALARIEAAVQESEKRHAGQVRFAVESALDPLAIWRRVSATDRALDVFSSLRVWDTEHNNGVLVYLLLADHDVEIVADRGIHQRVGTAAWEAICREMEAHFRAGRFEQGVLDGIERISRHLEAHYPPRGGADELPNRPVVL
jgi:uncharacterized membrane protein